MKTDPRVACANAEERRGWAILHDLVAHPLLILTGYSIWALAFHDYTSHKAWPRPPYTCRKETKVATIYGRLTVIEVAPGVYSIQHGFVAHKFVTTAANRLQAVHKALDWFDVLAVEVGGIFKPRLYV
jgi:hypothetical protein